MLAQKVKSTVKNMITHYIPSLLLRPFAVGEHVKTYDFKTGSVENKKLKNTFSGSDLFDSELEKMFSVKLEGPFGDLLSHKLLHNETITLNRQENLLLRKFLMINFLRAPIVNTDWDEMVERTELKDHPSVQAREFLVRHCPELKSVFDNISPSAENYIENLKKAMEIDSLEELARGEAELGVSVPLQNAAGRAMTATIAFWDSSDTAHEFVLPKLPGITEMDNVSIFHKNLVLQARRNQLEQEWLPGDMEMELQRLQLGSAMFPENYSIYPISPTRCIICFSPYFRAFFPMRDVTGKKELYPPLLKKAQFDRHFYMPPRMELFRPCEARFNRSYSYQVKKLMNEEVYSVNTVLLDMETEEFAFHDINKLRDSFRYYDNEAVLACKKKHDFSSFYK